MSNDKKVIMANQTWDNPDLYRILGTSEIMTWDKIVEKHPPEEYIIIKRDWDDIEGTKTGLEN